MVTANWFSPDHETFFNCVLDFVRIEHPHDGETTFKASKKITDDFRITDRIVSVTADNAVNLDSAMDWWQIELPHIIRVRCAAHVINLVCQEGVKGLQDTISVVRAYAKKLGHH